MPYVYGPYPIPHQPLPELPEASNGGPKESQVKRSSALCQVRFQGLQGQRGDGPFARMLVRTAGRWTAKGGTASAQTKLVGMRGHD